MALKFVEKAEKPQEDPKKLPEGADRFMWTEVPESAQRPVIKKTDYAWILKGEKPSA
jgi:hypothetical protein